MTEIDYAARRKALADALRSGEYKQGRGQLRPSDDEYCCLGVACDVSGVGEWVRTFPKQRGWGWEYVHRDEWAYVCDGDRSLGVMPKPVTAYFGFREASGRWSGGSLIDGNDWGATFDRIADLVEDPPEGLFEPMSEGKAP